MLCLCAIETLCWQVVVSCGNNFLFSLSTALGTISGLAKQTRKFFSSSFCCALRCKNFKRSAMSVVIAQSFYVIHAFITLPFLVRLIKTLHRISFVKKRYFSFKRRFIGHFH
ncbi:hypothetical protein EGW08_002138 [Elysia chlorotica]|uniref:Uncharacterized protein n=1 Tax=Elysia chlorotica TaxID=188477 RepID=A0A433U8H3_ELYCH|nr:hypothetical protein EGW08_002138 [Elysia chlorotica]